MYVLSIDKQLAAIAGLAEGNSTRSIERITGIHRDTIMRVGVRVSEACPQIMDEKMRGLSCRLVEVDEIWGFIRSSRSGPAGFFSLPLARMR